MYLEEQATFFAGANYWIKKEKMTMLFRVLLSLPARLGEGAGDCVHGGFDVRPGHKLPGITLPFLLDLR